jgi:hypothetical protein
MLAQGDDVSGKKKDAKMANRGKSNAPAVTVTKVIEFRRTAKGGWGAKTRWVRDALTP